MTKMRTNESTRKENVSSSLLLDMKLLEKY